MCLAVPGQIQSYEGEAILREGVVQFGPLSKKVNLALSELERLEESLEG